jgi:nucleotide-binding universal stress UspA family protein
VAGPRLVSLTLAVLMALADVLAGQSMGEAAQRERERRARIAKKPAPSYTDSDLVARRGDRPVPASPSPSPGASPAPAPPLEDEHDVRARQEAEWRARFEAARERVRQAEAAAWHTVVETVFVSGIPVQQHVRKFAETPELRAANQALADLEEQFRRTGLPPGWSR